MQTMRRMKSTVGFATEHEIISSRLLSLVHLIYLLRIAEISLFIEKEKFCGKKVFYLEKCILESRKISWNMSIFSGLFQSFERSYRYFVSGTLDADTQILLTSALYFKGRWLKSFDRHATRLRCFRVPARGCQNILMMENSSKYRYGYIGSLDADVVEIPYSVWFLILTSS